MSGGTTGWPCPGGSERAARTTRVPAPSSLRSIKGPRYAVDAGLFGGRRFLWLLFFLGCLEGLGALDQVRDLLAALSTDPLEVPRAVLRCDRAAALLADPTEELGTVFVGRAGSALLPDLLVELRAVFFADQSATHSSRFGDGHAATSFPCHGLLLFRVTLVRA